MMKRLCQGQELMVEMVIAGCLQGLLQELPLAVSLV